MSDLSTGLSAMGVNNREQGGLKTTSPALLALVATVIVLVAQFAGGIANVDWFADDGMRLVQVRDLLAGQSWFDTTQYRLGPGGGTLMHWSRLIDAPIAFIIHAATMLTGDPMLAERIAAHLWPAILLFFALWALSVAAQRIGTDSATVLIVGSLTFVLLAEFQPGAFDHHGAQIVLGLWTVSFLLGREDRSRNHALAGAAAVVMLAIGMESLPYVAPIGVWVALGFAIDVIDGKSARAFGLALPAAAFLIFLLTVSPDRYAEATCDAYSLFHVTMASVGGFGLAFATFVGATRVHRFVVLSAVSAIVGAVALTAFRDCIATPLQSLDPQLTRYWLGTIVEAQSLSDSWRLTPTRVVGSLGLPVLGLVVALAFAFRPAQTEHMRFAAALYAVLIASAIAVSVWQVRAAVFALTFALLPMAHLVVMARGRYLQNRSMSALGGLFLAWFVSFYPSWWAPSVAFKTPAESQLASDVGLYQCFPAQDIADLAVIESNSRGSTVLAARFDAAVPILLGTNHRVLTGNYHRNETGNLAWISMMMASPEDAETIARQHGVTHIVDCAGAWETEVFPKHAPGGLQASLTAGNIPQWLNALPFGDESRLRIYQVAPR